jgi:hypothetical protein|tara:strand:+ start:819 stop:1007 length:189 start_codon:yes stop_codon:yes gene_type:complete
MSALLLNIPGHQQTLPTQQQKLLLLLLALPGLERDPLLWLIRGETHSAFDQCLVNDQCLAND